MADSSPLAHSPTLAVTGREGEPRLRGEDGGRVEAGVQIGEYVVEHFLGAGAMGEVYAGRHPVIGKRVAIKILRHELGGSGEAAERFIREARAANQIDHDNVVDVFAFGRTDDGRMYLVMDLVEGRSLRAHLVDGPLELGAALDILETIADALDAAHARGVVHRDLKPDNIVLSSATPPKVFVLDFGIAKLISTAAEGGPAVAKSGPGTLTGAGTWLGTPGYMAPEQWSVDGAGPASDRYALGVIAFELLTGAQPYTATSVPAMMEQHFRAEIPTLSSRGAVGLPGALDSVVRKALAKDPDARYASARELVTALRDAGGTGAMRARGAVSPPSGPRKLWMPAVAGIGVLGVGIVAVVVLAKDRSPPETQPGMRASTAPRAGEVSIAVTSTPGGAEVRTSNGAHDVTPTEVSARPGETVEIRVRMPGYLIEQKQVAVGPSNNTADFRLIAVDEFNGVWQLPTGELRAFKRRGKAVDVFKLATVRGDPEFFKSYAFDLVDSGVGFSAEDVIVDPHAPTEPTCSVHMGVDYVYDIQKDMLVQEREHVAVDFVGGKCVERERRIVSSTLVRVDRATAETHELALPVGELTKKQVLQKPVQPAKTTKVVPLDPKADLERKKQAEIAAEKKAKTAAATKTAEKLAPQKRASKGSKASTTGLDVVGDPTTPTYTSPRTVPSGAEQNLGLTPNAQIAPSPTAPPPQANEPVPQVQQSNAPIQSKQKK